MGFFKRTRYVMVPPGVNPLEDVDHSMISKPRISFWLALGLIMLAGFCLTSILAMSQAKPAGAAAPTQTQTPTWTSTATLPEQTATPTLASSFTPTTTLPQPVKAVWVTVQVQVTRVIWHEVTRVVTEIWHDHQTVVVTRLISTTPQPSQTPWIVTATYTSTPTETSTPEPTDTSTSSPEPTETSTGTPVAPPPP